MGRPAIIVFLDANVASSLKKLLESHDPRIQVLSLDKPRKRAKDREILNYLEAVAVDEKRINPQSNIFILTHDLNFEIDSDYRLGSPVSIIKIPQPSKGRTLSQLAIGALQEFFSHILNSTRSIKILGIIEIN